MLIAEGYEITTPQEMVKACKRLGFENVHVFKGDDDSCTALARYLCFTGESGIVLSQHNGIPTHYEAFPPMVNIDWATRKKHEIIMVIWTPGSIAPPPATQPNPEGIPQQQGNNSLWTSFGPLSLILILIFAMRHMRRRRTTSTPEQR